MKQSAIMQRFLGYVQINTRSVLPKSGEERVKPSSDGQKELASVIRSEIAGMGSAWTGQITEFTDGSFLACLPATKGCEQAPHVAFAAHMDTYFGVPGDTKPIVHAYEGGDIKLPNDGVVIPAADLVGLEGKHIVTSDGTSLLGGDDKAGVAAMVTTIQEILTSGMAHGPLTFWFCVDEEIGSIDIEVVDKEIVKSWDVFWNVDGERVGTVDVGCFVCRFVDVIFKGSDAHPGVQGDKLCPAHYAAASFMTNLVEEKPAPWDTDESTSFYYVTKIEGNASQAIAYCAPRTFDLDESERMLETIKEFAESSAWDFDCTYEVKDRLICVNARVAIEPRMALIKPGVTAHRKHGFSGDLHDVRGGTDGAMVNMVYPKLPAPNMGTGAKNLHGLQEFLVVEELEVVPSILLDMIAEYAKMPGRSSL
ncbi:MAG: M20/M25/M40 family metallo-hydrolase [Patescibacteria group bacterium]